MWVCTFYGQLFIQFDEMVARILLAGAGNSPEAEVQELFDETRQGRDQCHPGFIRKLFDRSGTMVLANGAADIDIAEHITYCGAKSADKWAEDTIRMFCHDAGWLVEGFRVDYEQDMDRI